MASTAVHLIFLNQYSLPPQNRGVEDCVITMESEEVLSNSYQHYVGLSSLNVCVCMRRNSFLEERESILFCSETVSPETPGCLQMDTNGLEWSCLTFSNQLFTIELDME